MCVKSVLQNQNMVLEMSEDCLSLVIINGRMIVDCFELTKDADLVKKVIPNRSPDKERNGEKAWVIQIENRRLFGKYLVGLLEGDSVSNECELLCFFGLVGIGKRFVDNKNVRWCLYLGSRMLKVGGVL